MAEITKEKLKEMYCKKGMTMKEIGDYFDCCLSNISYHLKKHKLSKNVGELEGKYLECVICGKEFYVPPSKIGRRKHCSRKCRNKNPEWRSNEEQRKGKYINCEHCGKEFYVKRARLGRTKYCSKKCMNEHSKTGEYINCQNCGEEFYVEKNRISERKYCSRECGRDSLKNRVECKCVICGKNFEVIKSKYDKYPCRCCSQECLNKWYRRPETMSGIEKTTNKVLEKLNVNFEVQKYLDGWRFDFYLPNYNLFIEIDGDYWHGNTKFYNKLNNTQIENAERDKRKNKWCEDNGYNIERIWGSDIKENAKKHIRQVVKKYQTNESKAVVL